MYCVPSSHAAKLPPLLISEVPTPADADAVGVVTAAAAAVALAPCDWEPPRVYVGRVRIAVMVPLPPPSTVIWKLLCSPLRASYEALE